ncbi:MAG TPA: hypothetical protein VFZ61_29440, partial [Polyangiales bacterium]
MPGSTRKLPLSGLATTLLAAVALGACGDEDDADLGADAETAQGADAGERDGGGEDGSQHSDGSAAQDGGGLDASPGDAASVDVPRDAAAPDAATPAVDGGSADAAETGACTPGANGCPADPLAPFKLDCANLPSNGVCVGGPREVLLVTEETGVITMFDPADGHYLGFFKRRSAKYNINWIEEYR